MSGAAIATGGGQDPESEFGHDQVKVFSHEGDDVENTEHLNSMDLHDVKSELEKDAEKAEVSYFAHTSCRKVSGADRGKAFACFFWRVKVGIISAWRVRGGSDRGP